MRPKTPAKARATEGFSATFNTVIGVIAIILAQEHAAVQRHRDDGSFLSGVIVIVCFLVEWVEIKVSKKCHDMF